ncbi:D-alanyl-D-alanine carboxypeptidase [Aneurinibacillus sp. Ricciae_BoGa-3]|uniref:D-alanyl-D-alanine carboxypeptidase family protein n=1 Tax=Aneurinibacillus sp. Ricciae_BoGa-3 TaxID=3022697 RepID=UPI002342546D|nr:D-alanyl-D-alanine carboxypeptidase family protein [Aneurinibacillus sp. Ricciae_BoGa-3]WCK56374.1 D-alanyl-D-alanine carboxypeptidase [Aneurinibacillus sp. Ricciae_BoGa-3]
MKKCFNLLLLCIFLVVTIGLPVYADDTPSIESVAAIVVDDSSQSVLYQKNADAPMFPASITKIVTAVLAIESGRLNDKVTISKEAADVEPTKLYMVPGEQKTVKQLLYGLMLHSGNDAAIALAEHFGGSIQGFAVKMNAFAEKVGATTTHFVNPNGLPNAFHYTTARDMAKITAYAMKNPMFRHIISTKTYYWKGLKWSATLTNSQPLLGTVQGVEGGKTGYTDKAKNTLVTSVDRNGKRLIIVTLQADGKARAYDDTLKLMNYGYSVLSQKPKNSPVVQKAAADLQIPPHKSLIEKPQIDKTKTEKFQTVNSVKSPVLPVWIVGALPLLLFGLIYYIRLKRRVFNSPNKIGFPM